MSTTGPDPSLPVDYAVPATVPRTSRKARADRPRHLWGGRGRTALKVGCWVGAVLLALPVLVPLLVADETGADSPEDAVAQLLQGIADIDPVAVVSVVDPVETDDPGRADAAYDELSSRLLRIGDVPPLDVVVVLSAAENQLGGKVDRAALATLAAVDLELDGLDLSPSAAPDGRVRVFVTDGQMAVSVDPGRLPDETGGLDRASYDMPIGEGWRRDGAPFDPYLVTVERDGRWYVSLEATADDLFAGLR